MTSRSVNFHIRVTVAAFFGLVLAAMGWLKWHEDDLVFATASSRRHIQTALPQDAERVDIPMAGTSPLAALRYQAGPPVTGYWVLHLHGNGDSAFSPWQLRHCEALRALGYGVLDIDYHGFGLTPGRASETGMYRDAEAAYQSLLQLGVADDHIIILGHSLGSGPAVMLAAHHAAAALVLFGAFTSIPDAAADRYPFLPVRYAASIHFDSLSRIHDVRIPVIITHSRTDTLIPYSHAERMFAAANDPKRLITFSAPADDGFGGHVDTLFQHLDVLQKDLIALLPPMKFAEHRP